MELLTPQEAAAFLKVTPRTVSIWLKEGKLPGFKLGTGRGAEWRLNKEDLLAYLQAHANEAQLVWEEERAALLEERNRVENAEKEHSRGENQEETGAQVTEDRAEPSQPAPAKAAPVEGNPLRTSLFDSRELAIAWDRYRKKRDIP